jgi:hypothetical protein
LRFANDLHRVDSCNDRRSRRERPRALHGPQLSLSRGGDLIRCGCWRKRRVRCRQRRGRWPSFCKFSNGGRIAAQSVSPPFNACSFEGSALLGAPPFSAENRERCANGPIGRLPKRSKDHSILVPHVFARDLTQTFRPAPGRWFRGQ